jgi:transcriptional regulator with XRE-family HTH domain
MMRDVHVGLDHARLREMRINRGFCLMDLARRLGITKQRVSQIELSTGKAQISTIYRLSEALDVNPLELLTGDPTDIHRVTYRGDWNAWRQELRQQAERRKVERRVARRLSHREHVIAQCRHNPTTWFPASEFDCLRDNAGVGSARARVLLDGMVAERILDRARIRRPGRRNRVVVYRLASPPCATEAAS